MAVQSVLESLGINYLSIELGRVKLAGALERSQVEKLDAALRYYQLEFLENPKMILVERIKNMINEMIRASTERSPFKFSEHLSASLHYDYTYLANTFSELEGGTIERYYILQRIERVKELIVYEDMTIKEISYLLNYSSIPHLSLQFKKVTGLTPSQFRKLSKSEEYVWRTCE